MDYRYLILFLLGGTLVSGTKYLSNKVSPMYAATLGSLPIGLLISITFKDKDIIDHFIENYAGMTFILLMTALLYHVLMLNNVSIYISYGITLLFWVTMVILKLKFVKL